MLQGVQTGILMDGQGNGIKIEVVPSTSSVTWQVIVNQVVQPVQDHQVSTLKDVYDSRTGSYVLGFELFDQEGQPTGEVYQLNQFQLCGNLSYGDYRSGQEVKGWY